MLGVVDLMRLWRRRMLTGSPGIVSLTTAWIRLEISTKIMLDRYRAFRLALQPYPEGDKLRTQHDQRIQHLRTLNNPFQTIESVTSSVTSRLEARLAEGSCYSFFDHRSNADLLPFL
jgi:hypothetical protein